ncbi:MAG TPA: hypothetical protein VG758_20825 [Hyphomicrobiaceae bacterium]|jgi:hypothetical protein|nr:hypothetical protein [Hyphomicrobiaceae bacterium]
MSRRMLGDFASFCFGLLSSSVRSPYGFDSLATDDLGIFFSTGRAFFSFPK